VADIYLVKRHGVLMPNDEADEELLNGINNNDLVKCVISRPRNAQFHRKYFALLDVIYNQWHPINMELNGKPAAKNRDRFRSDIAIATGYYDLVVNIKNEVRAEARSISFAAMDEVEFAALYSRTIDYALQKICTGRDRDTIDNWVNQILEFS